MHFFLYKTIFITYWFLYNILLKSVSSFNYFIWNFSSSVLLWKELSVKFISLWAGIPFLCAFFLNCWCYFASTAFTFFIEGGKGARHRDVHKYVCMLRLQVFFFAIFFSNSRQQYSLKSCVLTFTAVWAMLQDKCEKVACLVQGKWNMNL